LTGPERSDKAAWAENVVAKTAPLTTPLYLLPYLTEFGAVAARADVFPEICFHRLAPPGEVNSIATTKAASPIIGARLALLWVWA